MEKRTRRILYYPLLAIFIAATPFLLLYSLGYSFDFMGQSITGTGGIFIKSKVSDINVYLDSQQVKGTSFFSGSALFTDVPVGTHEVRLEREGFESWTKSVPVTALTVIEFRNILIVPVTPTIATTSVGDLPATSTGRALLSSLTLEKEGKLLFRESGTTTIVAESVHSFSVFEDVIYFVNRYGFLGRYNTVTQETETIGHPGFYLGEAPFQFVESPRGDIAVIDSSGGLFLTDPDRPLAPIDSNVRQAVFDARGDKLLIQKENELALFWLVENQIQPFQKRFTKETVIISNDSIQNASWFYEDNWHILFHTASGVYFTEIDGRGGRNTYRFFESPFNEFFTSPDAPSGVYARKGRFWYRIEI